METAILAMRVVVVIFEMMIANIVVLVYARIVVIGRARKLVMRIVGMLNRSRELVVYMLSLAIHELFVTVEFVWVFVFVFALVLRNGKWVRVGIRIRKGRSRRSSRTRARRSRRSRGAQGSGHRRRWRLTSLRYGRARGASGHRRTLGARWITLANGLGSRSDSRNRRRYLGRTPQRSAKRRSIPSMRKVVVPVRDAERGTILDDGV